MRYFFLLLLFAPGLTFAQSTRWENLTEADGLGSATTTSITQDSFGFMWFGGWGGVSRFDGKTFRNFATSPFDSTSLASQDGRYVAADHKGGVWVAVQNNGLDYFDPELDGFRHYGEDKGAGGQRFNEIAVGEDGGVWALSANKILRFDENMDRFVTALDLGDTSPYLLKPGPKGSLYFSAFPAGVRSWEGMEFGILSSEGSVSYISYPTILPTMGVDDVRFTVSAKSELAVFAGKKLAVLTLGGSWRLIENIDPECMIRAEDAEFDAEGKLWVNALNAVCQVGLDSGKVVVHKNDPTNPNSILISASNENGIFIDRQGVVWATRWGKGVSRLDPSATQFDLLEAEIDLPTGNVMAALENEDGSFWVGMRDVSPNTLVLVQPDRRFKTYVGSTTFGALPGTKESSGLAHPFIWDLERSPDGSIWVGNTSPGRGGLNRLYPDKKKVVQFGHDPNDESTLHGNEVYVLESDGLGNIWVGTWNPGLSQVNYQSNKVTGVLIPSGTGQDESVQAEVTAMAASKDGSVWIASNGRYGLFKADPQTLELQRFDVPNPNDPTNPNGLQSIGAIHEDDAGRLWIGTEHLGFGEYDPELQAMKSMYDKSLLNVPSLGIVAIQSDHLGRLWLATRRGIVRFDPETERAVHYGIDAGLSGLNFGSTANERGPSGKIYFSTSSGLVIIDPEKITANPSAPEVVFTNLKVDGKTVRPSDSEVLSSPITLAKSIVLSPSTSSVEFEFAAMHYANPDQNRFQFRMIGYEDSWRDGGTLGAASYTNLSPGTYTFEVKASSRDAVWSDPVSIAIRVLPPWWRTIWAYITYLILAVGAVITASRVQRARISAQEREKARQREVEQAREIEKQHVELTLAHDTLKKTQSQLVEQEKLASLGSLTAGIAHEIKNPLNFVNNFAEVGAEMADELSEAIAAGNSEEAQSIIAELRENAKQITKHGRRADDIVKAMMQHARGGASEREEVAINAFIEEYSNLAWHGMRAKDHGFEAELIRDYSSEAGTASILPQELGRVILNLLNNAFDAVKETEGAKVTIATGRDASGVHISVSDNGPGIPDAIRDKIFEPFFTTKPTGEGTGLGLSLSYDIITKGHGGSMTAQTSADGGAMFTINLPFTQ